MNVFLSKILVDCITQKLYAEKSLENHCNKV